MDGIFRDRQLSGVFAAELPGSLKAMGWIDLNDSVLSQSTLAIDVFLISCNCSAVNRVLGSLPRS